VIWNSVLLSRRAPPLESCKYQLLHAPATKTRCPKTVPKLQVLNCLGLHFEREQIPQTVENTESPWNGWSYWKGGHFAQGRCATRLRYAPTLKPSDFTLLELLPRIFALVGESRLQNCRSQRARRSLARARAGRERTRDGGPSYPSWSDMAFAEACECTRGFR
jgi:hypothetical protein